MLQLLVEARRVELLSEGSLSSVSPSAAADLDLVSSTVQQQTVDLTSLSCTTQGQGTPCDVPRLDDVTTLNGGTFRRNELPYTRQLTRNCCLRLSLGVPFFYVYPKLKHGSLPKTPNPRRNHYAPSIVFAAP